MSGTLKKKKIIEIISYPIPKVYTVYMLLQKQILLKKWRLVLLFPCCIKQIIQDQIFLTWDIFRIMVITLPLNEIGIIGIDFIYFKM